MTSSLRWPVATLAAVGLLAPPAWAEVTAYRIVDMDFRDPHFYMDIIGCRDVTDTPIFGFSMNGDLQTLLTTDGDGDGNFDLSYVIVFDPLDQGGAGGTLRFGTVDCVAPPGEPGCTRGVGGFLQDLPYQNSPVGSCLTPLAGTLRPYSPGVISSSAPCFATDAADVTLTLGGGIPLTLRSCHIAATYQGSPAANLVNGLIRGFLPEADANATIIPASFPVVGGMPLSLILPGGNVPGVGATCAPHSDKDIGPDAVTQGWYFYLNYSAVKTPYSDLTVPVGEPARFGVSLAAAQPNPFQASTRLLYTLDREGEIRLTVHDVQGRLVAELERGMRPAGRHTATWSGRDAGGARVAAGIYVVRLESAGETRTQRVALLR